MGRKNRKQSVEATEAVEQPVEATEAVEQPTEATEAVEQPTEVEAIDLETLCADLIAEGQPVETTEAVEQATEAVEPKAKLAPLARWLRGAKHAKLTPADASTLPATTTIKVVATGNPKRGAAAYRFAWYVDGMSLADYIAVQQKAKPGKSGERLARLDTVWDFDHGFIDLVAPIAPEVANASAEQPIATVEQPEMANA